MFNKIQTIPNKDEYINICREIILAKKADTFVQTNNDIGIAIVDDDKLDEINKTIEFSAVVAEANKKREVIVSYLAANEKADDAILVNSGCCALVFLVAGAAAIGRFAILNDENYVINPSCRDTDDPLAECQAAINTYLNLSIVFWTFAGACPGFLLKAISHCCLNSLAKEKIADMLPKLDDVNFNFKAKLHSIANSLFRRKDEILFLSAVGITAYLCKYQSPYFDANECYDNEFNGYNENCLLDRLHTKKVPVAGIVPDAFLAAYSLFSGCMLLLRLIQKITCLPCNTYNTIRFYRNNNTATEKTNLLNKKQLGPQ